MSMASNPQHEPTMEEILASIRKIISEDSTESAPAGSRPADGDVLELTQEVHEDTQASAPMAEEPAPPAPEPAPPAHAAPAVPPEPEARTENDVVFQTIEEVAVSEPPAAAHEGIFSEKTRKALEDSFSGIPAARAEPATPAPAETAAAPDGASVQAVFEKAVRDGFAPVLHQWLGDNSADVLEKLKPLVREWMDDHFPALLEGAIRAEVERVARARH
jgi:cell pole-organizing protein PopZ